MYRHFVNTHFGRLNEGTLNYVGESLMRSDSLGQWRSQGVAVAAVAPPPLGGLDSVVLQCFNGD